MNTRLFKKWLELLIIFSVKEETARDVYKIILDAYGEPVRFYHTLSHVEDVLKAAAGMEHLADDFHAIKLAIWFHDIVYNPKSADNEAQSADLCRKLLSSMAIPGDMIQKVEEIILATSDHTNPTGNKDINILLDADLAILGSDRATYDAYRQAIRQEYHWVEDSIYRIERVKVLERFLDRPSIYRTQLMIDTKEAKACENLIMEIIQLTL